LNLTLGGLQGGKKRKPRRRSGEVRRQEVVEAASKLFREKGYHGTSMQDIGDAVGIYKGSLYEHITSKEDLLFAVIGGGLEWTTSRLEAIGNSQLSPLEKLKEAVKHHINATATLQDVVGVLLEDAKHLSGAKRRSVVKLQERYEEIIQQILEDGIRAGQFRPCDVKIVSFAILGMCNWIYRWYSEQGRLTPEEIARVFTDFILQGIGLETAREAQESSLLTLGKERKE
jgi:AcrR family transcriptional regulator